MRRSTLVFVLGLLGCHSPRGASPAASAPSSSRSRTSAAQHHVGVHASTLAVHRGRVLVLGRERTPAVDEGAAWTASFDPEGRMLWSTRPHEGVGWAEDVVATPTALYVFGRDAEDRAWLSRLDFDGQVLGSAELQTGQVLGFEASTNAIDLILSQGATPPGIMGHVGLTWLHWRDSAPEPRIVRARVELDAYSLGELECWALDALTLSCNDEVLVLTQDPGSGTHQLEVDYDDREEADEDTSLELGEASQEPLETLQLVTGEPLALELDTGLLLLVQLAPETGRDAELVVVPTDEVEREPALTALTTLSATIGDQAPTGPWRWLAPLADPGQLASTQQAELAAWLLADTHDCYPVELDHSCGDSIVAYPLPSYFEPEDPCWKLAMLETVADASSPDALRANLPAWSELIAQTDFRPRGMHWTGYESEWTPSEAVYDSLVDSVPPEVLIPHLVLELDTSSMIPLDAIAALEDLPGVEAEPIARGLVEELRYDPERCEEVVALAEVLEQVGAAPPRWRADLTDPCDILYVMCTELQDDLADRVVGPRGFTVTETCAENADSPCTPTRERSTEFEFGGISPEVAAACGTNEAWTEQTYSCGAPDPFDVYTYQWREDPAGRVWFVGLDIHHTTVY